MNDTRPEIEQLVREQIMARSGEERFVMGAEMFEAARAMMCASFPTGLSPDDLKRRIFERLYGEPLNPAAVRETPDREYSVDPDARRQD